jgi:hypothetical protein
MIHEWDWQLGSTMTNTCSERREGGTLWLSVLFTLLMPAIFAMDVATGYQFRLSDLYCVVALLMSRLAGIGAGQAIVSTGFLLTLASVADAYGFTAAALLHAAISLALLGAVAIFILRSDRATVSRPVLFRRDQNDDDGEVLLLNDLRQPLSVVLSDSRASLRWLKREQPDLPEAMLCAQRIVTNATRAGEMISAMGQRVTH